MKTTKNNGFLNHLGTFQVHPCDQGNSVSLVFFYIFFDLFLLFSKAKNARYKENFEIERIGVEKYIPICVLGIWPLAG